MSATTGQLIIFDGPDGAGKTTQVEHVAKELSSQGFSVHLTRGHGGSPFGEELRTVSLGGTPRSARADLYLSLAIHSELQADISDRLQQGEIILMDRGPDSIWAYQVYGDGLDAAFAAPLIDNDRSRFNPRLTLCYIASLSTLRGRMSARPGPKADYFENKGDAYFERVISGYQFAAKRYRNPIINAEPDVATVYDETMRLISAVLTNSLR